MNDLEEPQSIDPRFWLEFRTFDDGRASHNESELKSAAATFPQFALLPPELRLKIWSHLVLPRVVVACCLQRDNKLNLRRKQLRHRTNAPSIPVLLRINRESRMVGLEHYELAFGWKISKLLSDTPVSRPAQVWFNFAQDALYLTGELEAFDSYGFNSPMVYFLKREDTVRVRHIACAFAELGYPHQESEQIFGCLWHVVDRFPHVQRLLLTMNDGDEEHMKGSRMLSTDNVVQKIWSGWMGGITVTNTEMAGKQMLLVKEQELVEVIASQSQVE